MYFLFRLYWPEISTSFTLFLFPHLSLSPTPGPCYVFHSTSVSPHPAPTTSATGLIDLLLLSVILLLLQKCIWQRCRRNRGNCEGNDLLLLNWFKKALRHEDENYHINTFVQLYFNYSASCYPSLYSRSSWVPHLIHTPMPDIGPEEPNHLCPQTVAPILEAHAAFSVGQVCLSELGGGSHDPNPTY